MSVRVLVVDDADYVRRLVSAVIEQHDRGWSVVGEAADGQQAIDAASHSQPDLVLLDLSMPVMDGLEALPHLRQKAPSASVVVLTGFSSSTAQQAARDAGAHGYLTKDDLVDNLIPRLEELLAELHTQTATTPSSQQQHDRLRPWPEAAPVESTLRIG